VKEAIMTEDSSTPESNSDIIRIEVPEIEFKGDDPLHRGAIVLHANRTDSLNEAMLLLSESKDLLTAFLDSEADAPAYRVMAKDTHRRVRKALKALDKQEYADRDVYLALAETQRK
jgi:hypothetical protein